MTTTETATTVSACAGKYLVFKLALEAYGIAALHVREIVGINTFTIVPHTPKFIKGVMNLRGKIVPLVDLRLKFAMECCEYSRDTCIIVIEVAGSREKILIGVIVDAVREVIDVASSEIAEIPSFGVHVNTSFLSGMANIKSGLILLLDIAHVLSHEELVAVEATPDGAAKTDVSTLEARPAAVCTAKNGAKSSAK
jgi:purine-binding chemotaxis protein CheW